MKKINVGLVGFGTIGAGVVRALKTKKSFLAQRSGVDITLAVICDKDLRTKRPVSVNRKLLTSSITKVLYDPKIDIVIELVGGIRPAKDIVLEALRQGKHVVTANKALLADSAAEIFGLANDLGLSIGFEASVGGGIPIIKALKEAFIANKTDLIYGIINGTSNFILSKMAQDNIDFKEALALAQAKGYAERDPYLDISGGDSCHKLSILSLLGFGVSVKPHEIYTEGIVSIEPNDIRYAKEMGYAIKLLAIAKRVKGDLLELRVHPTLIPESHLIANVSGVYNAIFVKGDMIGDNMFYGQGAGANPTASAVVSDIVSIAKGMAAGKCCGQKGGSDFISFAPDIKAVMNIDDVKTRYYIRFSAMDKPGVLARVSGILGKYSISIASVSQKPGKTANIVPIVMMTHEASEKNMRKALKEIDALSIIKKKTVRVRVEG